MAQSTGAAGANRGLGRGTARRTRGLTGQLGHIGKYTEARRDGLEFLGQIGDIKEAKVGRATGYNGTYGVNREQQRQNGTCKGV